MEHRLQVLRLPQLQLTGSRAWAQWLRHAGFVAPWNVGSSGTRDQTVDSHPLSHQGSPLTHPFLGNSYSFNLPQCNDTNIHQVPPKLSTFSPSLSPWPIRFQIHIEYIHFSPSLLQYSHPSSSYPLSASMSIIKPQSLL